MIDVRFGAWQWRLADVERCDVLIYDAPYTQRVMLGFRSGSNAKESDRRRKEKKPNITYAAITPRHVRELAALAVRLKPKFIVAFNDHIGWRWLERTHKARGFYTFAPIVWHRLAGPPRFQGDGPADECEYIFVARPKGKNYVGSLPGFYETKIASQGIVSQQGRGEGLGLVGQKPLNLMRAIVRDYTSPGDVVVDPFCGTGTTALACLAEGRSCITAEIDRATFLVAKRRIRQGVTEDAIAALEAREAIRRAGEQLFAARQAPLALEAAE